MIPAPTPTPDSQIIQVNPDAPVSHPLWDSLGAGGYSAINAATMGIPDLLVKTVNSDAYKKLKDFQAANQGASDTGNALGTVGSLFIPGGALTKGLGAAAKGIGLAKAGEDLTKAGEFLGSTGNIGDATGWNQFLAQAGRGVGQAAEQAVPRALTQEATTGDVNPLDVALQVGAGGLLGGTVGTLGTQIGKLKNLAADEGGKAVEDAILSGADVGTRVVKTALNQTAQMYNLSKYGNFFNNADTFKAGLAKFITDHDLGDKLTRESYIEDNGPMWQAVAQKFNDQPLNVATPEFSQAFMSNPKIQELLTDPNIGEDGVKAIAQKMVAGISDPNTGGIVNDFNQAKSYLGDQISKYSKLSPGTPEAADQAQAGLRIASALKQAIDEHALSLDPAFADLKANYPYIQALKIASGLEKIKVENPLKEGSDTFQKLATNAALGGTVGAGTSEDKGAGAAEGALVGALGVPFASRILSKVGTQGLAGVAGLLSKAGQSPLGQKIGQVASDAVDQAPLAAARAPGAFTAAQPQANPEAPALVAPGTQQSQPLPTPATTPGAAGTQTAVNALPAVNAPVFKANLLSRLKTLYATGPFSQYDDFPTFVQNVAARTNNFDPRYIGNVLYSDPDAQKRYGKDILAAQQLSQLPLQDIINRASPTGGISDLLNTVNPLPNDKAQHQLNLSRLQSLANDGKPMSDDQTKGFQQELSGLSRLPQNQQIPQLYALLKSNHGVDIPELIRQGVYNG